jgi:hypothetical protein
MTSIFSGPKKPAALSSPPVVTPPARMPDPEDPGVIEAKRRAQRDAMTRGGRSSTILTGKPTVGDGSGGATSSFDSYGGSSLGTGA